MKTERALITLFGEARVKSRTGSDPLSFDSIRAIMQLMSSSVRVVHWHPQSPEAYTFLGSGKWEKEHKDKVLHFLEEAKGKWTKNLTTHTDFYYVDMINFNSKKTMYVVQCRQFKLKDIYEASTFLPSGYKMSDREWNQDITIWKRNEGLLKGIMKRGEGLVLYPASGLNDKNLISRMIDIINRNAGRESLSLEDIRAFTSLDSLLRDPANVSYTSPTNAAVADKTIRSEGNVFCTECGAVNISVNKFCIKCGSKLSHLTEMPTEKGVPSANADVIQAESQVTVEEDGRVKVIVELPGAKKETIDLRTTQDSIIVHAKNGKNFYTNIDLDYLIDPQSAKANYQNGILTVYVNKQPK
jgi:hypothetical protein